ncbi:hypothetical protein CK203_013374 [Vitis vinifera]|uniref:Uncharacterized protein n=1 Tax=Vitis vinifera TaxID=29760 RepID=A0A438EIJ8_VITVI|nr:hypothetical protein CK203_073704 [Vitis vinifera]RVX10976.1 hypothetical protein CK203_013374 [Vitis vinifera]
MCYKKFNKKIADGVLVRKFSIYYPGCCFVHKVVFGEDEIAYQIGETAEILSRGYLCATPHCVRVLSDNPFVYPSKALAQPSGHKPSFQICIMMQNGGCALSYLDVASPIGDRKTRVELSKLLAPKGEEASGVERSTFALFMQPDWYVGFNMDEKLNFPEEVHIHQEVCILHPKVLIGVHYYSTHNAKTNSGICHLTITKLYQILALA